MTTPTMDDTTHPTLPGLLSRVVGVVVSPGETFQQVVRAPKIAGMLFIIALSLGLASGVPQFTERGRAAALEMQVQAIERFTKQPVDPQMYEQMRQRAQQSNLTAYTALVSSMVGVPFVAVVITALFWAVFNTVLGGTASFKQVMAVVVHSQVISTLGALVAAPVMYARGVMSTTGVATLGALVPMNETFLLTRFLGMIDLFMVWWIAVLAIGLATLYKRPVGRVATGLYVFYGLLALGLASFLG